jgi:hypothetical protein
MCAISAQWETENTMTAPLSPLLSELLNSLSEEPPVRLRDLDLVVMCPECGSPVRMADARMERSTEATTYYCPNGCLLPLAGTRGTLMETPHGMSIDVQQRGA